MHSHLLLPNDLGIFIDRLNQEEYNAVIPSEYEIESIIGLHQLATILIDNTLIYQPDLTKLSPGLNYNMRIWMIITNDERLGQLLQEHLFPTDNLWKIVNYYRVHGHNVNFDAEEIGLVFPDDNATELEQQLADIFSRFVNFSGTAQDIINIFDELLEDYSFVAKYPAETFLFTLLLAPPLANMPQQSEKLVVKVRNYFQQRNLLYFSLRTQLIEANLCAQGGKNERAMELYESIEQQARQEQLHFLSAVRNNKGLLYLYTSQWDRAIELFQDMEKDMPDNPAIANNLADAYSHLGEMDTAWNYAKKFLELSDLPFIGNYEFIQPILHGLGLQEEQNALLERVERYAEEAPFRWNIINLKFMQARYARYQNSIDDAMVLINECVDESIDWKNLPLLFRLLIERINIMLDLYEDRPTANNRLRLFNAVEMMIQLSDEQSVAIASIQGLELRAQVYMLFDELQNAREDLYTAAKLAKEFEYWVKYEELEAELAEFKAIDDIEVDRRHGIFGRIRAHIQGLVGIGEGSATYEEQDYITHGSIIMNNSGMPIYTNYLTDKLKTDSTLISGLISAVSSMLNEATQSEGFLKKIQRDDFSLLFEPLQDYLVISIVSDDTFAARQKLQKFTDITREIMKKYKIGVMTSTIPQKFETELEKQVLEVLI